METEKVDVEVVAVAVIESEEGLHQVQNTVKYYLYCVRSIKQAWYYEITGEFIIIHTKNTFDREDDVSESLLMLVKSDIDVWNPTLIITSDTDTSIK